MGLQVDRAAFKEVTLKPLVQTVLLWWFWIISEVDDAEFTLLPPPVAPTSVPSTRGPWCCRSSARSTWRMPNTPFSPWVMTCFLFFLHSSVQRKARLGPSLFSLFSTKKQLHGFWGKDVERMTEMLFGGWASLYCACVRTCNGNWWWKYLCCWVWAKPPESYLNLQWWLYVVRSVLQTFLLPQPRVAQIVFWYLFFFLQSSSEVKNPSL